MNSKNSLIGAIGYGQPMAQKVHIPNKSNNLLKRDIQIAMENRTIQILPENYSSVAVKIYKSLGRVDFGDIPEHDLLDKGIDVLVTRLEEVDKRLLDMLPDLKI